MKTFLFYTLQLISSSGLLYTYYHFFLRNKTLHIYNRFFLMGTMLVGILIPFCHIPFNLVQANSNPTTLLNTLSVISAAKFEEGSATPSMRQQLIHTFPATTLLIIVLAMVSSFLLARFILGLLRIRRISRSYPHENMGGITFINTDEEATPFSFFRLLFWNRKIDLHGPDGQQIFRHEMFHIRQKHSLDIMIVEIIAAMAWFNPFFYLIRRELKTIHEFMADQAAVTPDEEWAYAELLLMQVLDSPNHRLTNPFFHNQIKRRITMLTSLKKTRYQSLRKWFVLPLAAMLFVLFGFRYQLNSKSFAEKALKPNQFTVVIDAGHGKSTGSVAPDGTREADLALALANKVQALNRNDHIHIVLTRSTSEDLDLRKRSDFANAQHPDLFISIHLNNADKNQAATAANEEGFDAFISSKNASFYPENKIAASILLNYFSNFYTVNKKIQQRDEGIWVLDNSSCPSVLLECGYLSNPKDLAFIKTIPNQEKVARAILQSVEQYAIQKDLPNFEEKKKQVADSSFSGLHIERNADGKLVATYKGLPVINYSAAQVQKGKDNILVLRTDQDLIVLSQEMVNKFHQQWGAGWDELVAGK